MEKKLIGSVYLKDGKAVKSYADFETLSDDPVAYAVRLSDMGADELLLWDLSDSKDDEARARSIDCVKAICAASDAPVTGVAQIAKMEDVKKLLYAGCKKVVLLFADAGDTLRGLTEAHLELLKEVSTKFGKEKIIVAYDKKQVAETLAEPFSQYASALLLLGNGVAQEQRAQAVRSQPLMISLLDASFEDVVELLGEKNVLGVCGPFVDDHVDALYDRKRMLTDIGIDTTIFKPQRTWDDFKKNEQGLVPVVVQDYRTNEILMVAYMNREAYETTLVTGRMTYFSRERKKLWVKGEESGHFQYVKELIADCDLDTLLARVKQIGAACHTGNRSCFFNDVARRDYQEKNPQRVLQTLYEVVEDRKAHPKEGSYTNYLFDKGVDKILKKLGEESTEIVIAAKNDGENELHYEIADYLYHLTVLMSARGVTWEEITDELSRR